MNDLVKRNLLTRKTMSEAQTACLDLLCEVFHGEHHTPDRIYAFGRGIKCNVFGSQMATFDFDYLTRLVVLAHDRCVRVEIAPSGPGRVGLALFKRAGRDGSIYDRHPTMEQALERIRPRVAQAA